jgi:predicted nuclease of predicted toxin-antitoxin system
MKLKLDENLPEQLVVALRQLGHDVHTVPEEFLSGHPDENIRQAAQHEGRFLITQDLDFSDVRRFQPGTHAGLLLVRLHAPGRRALTQRISAVFATEQVETWIGCFAILTDHKLRVRRA